MRTGKEWIHCTGGVSKRFGPVVMMLDFLKNAKKYI